MIYLAAIVLGIVTTIVAVKLMVDVFEQAINDVQTSYEIKADEQRYDAKRSFDKIEAYITKINGTFGDLSGDIESRLKVLEKNSSASISVNKDTKRDKIKTLKAAGLSSSEIAKQLDMGKGEVNLLLNINK